MLYGKNIVLGVSGGIAAYKSCEIVSRFVKLGANVDVIMTEHAEHFVTPLTFETLSGNKVVRGMFEERTEFDVRHVSLAKKADVLLVAPATANVIAKFAGGIADDMLSTTWLACGKGHKVVAPAMNTAMYDDPATMSNLQILRSRGVTVIEPATGRLACGDTGKGKMAEPVDIVEAVMELLQPVRDWEGKRVLVTAGATEEYIDGVRFITNRSSGKMGCAIAEAAAQRGAEVVLVHGNLAVPVPSGVASCIKTASTAEMYDAVMAEAERGCDAFIMAAAPADYRPKHRYEQKIKSKELTIEFEKNPDIAAAVGRIKNDAVLVVFSAETEELLVNAKAKLKNKNADFAVANDVTKEGAGFNVDTNIVTIIDKNGKIEPLEMMPKRVLADVILDKAKEFYGA